jgi:hypothetical protein
LRRLVGREPCAVGASDRGGLVEDRKTECLDVVAPKHRLALQRQRCDRIGDRIDQEFSPRQRVEIGVA